MFEVGDDDFPPEDLGVDLPQDLDFPLGQLLATPGAIEALQESQQTPREFLTRHCHGDWGEVCHDDRLMNNQAVATGARILSAYTTHRGVRLWVITDAANDFGERTSTTILLPQEY